MNRYVCIHGHFYQPPRENPGLEEVELQDSAHPWHDWNARITAECYAPNAAARVQADDPAGRGNSWITRFANNYARISFDFGPTLLWWLERHAPEVHDAVVAADKESATRFSGHGNALAQVYHHAIMPLCNDRDRLTQVRWGIRDFELRFGRKPEGMWLAETAVDLKSLEVLAAHGIRFTILAPRQAWRVRAFSERAWKDVSGDRVDPRRAYLCRLPSGRSIALFFYDGPVSRAIAFEGLLHDGRALADRLLALHGAAAVPPGEPQLVHVATDGESYGHHHRLGEMALAAALDRVEESGARLTNYGEFLEMHPPEHEVAIFENSSWSCAHGVERWRADCGCHAGRGAGWNQAWRTPLRQALEELRDELAPRYEAAAAETLRAPWDARDDYVDVVTRRDAATLDAFLAKHRKRPLDASETERVRTLLELQRNALYAFTSCGWFFDDVSGIETVQVLAYADRMLFLAERAFGPHSGGGGGASGRPIAEVEEAFLQRLAEARSNVPGMGDGRAVFEKLVRPIRVDLPSVAAHFAIRSIFEPLPEHGHAAADSRAARRIDDVQTRVYCYRIDEHDLVRRQNGRSTLLAGRLRVTSTITGATAHLACGVAHFGAHVLNGAVRGFPGDDAYARMVEDVTDAFMRSDFPETVRRLDRHFGLSTYSLKSLFRDEQRRIVERILEGTLARVEQAYRRIFESHGPLMRFLADIGVPLPRPFTPAVAFALNSYLREALQQEIIDTARVDQLLASAASEHVELDRDELAFSLKARVDALSAEWTGEPWNLAWLERLDQAVGVARAFPFEIDLGAAQLAAWRIGRTLLPQARAQAATTWVAHFERLATTLRVRPE